MPIPVPLAGVPHPGAPVHRVVASRPHCPPPQRATHACWRRCCTRRHPVAPRRISRTTCTRRCRHATTTPNCCRLCVASVSIPPNISSHSIVFLPLLWRLPLSPIMHHHSPTKLSMRCTTTTLLCLLCFF